MKKLPSVLEALFAILVLASACGSQSAPSAPSQQQTSAQPAGKAVPPTPALTAVAIGAGAQTAPTDLQPRKPETCPDLESALFQIAQAPDPLSQAKQLRLQIKGDKIQVLLILEREDTSVPQNFEIEIGTRSGTQVQAFVPISQLCDLANTKEVVAIRLPAQATQ